MGSDRHFTVPWYYELDIGKHMFAFSVRYEKNLVHSLAVVVVRLALCVLYFELIFRSEDRLLISLTKRSYSCL